MDETSHALLAWSSVYWLAFQDSAVLLEVENTIKSEHESHGNISGSPKLERADEMVDTNCFIKADWIIPIRLFCLRTIINPMVQSINEKVLSKCFRPEFLVRPDLKFESMTGEQSADTSGLNYVCSSVLSFVQGRDSASIDK